MFGIGLMELAVIAVLGILVMGPERIPELAKQAAGLVKSAKHASNSVRDELRTSLGPDYADLELTDLNPRTLARKHVFELLQDDDRDEQDDLDQLDDPADLEELDELDDLEELNELDESADADRRSPVNDLTERHVS